MAAMLVTTMAGFAEEKTPAFPGAEGFGRYTTGGRGGAVYHVTRLDDDNEEGSLRWACNRPGKRTIVFDVSGTIYLKSALALQGNNVTIAGQTAPGGGICIADYPFTINADNVILRYLRFRLGNRNVAYHEGDGLGAMDHNNIIVDHCSVSWSIDECMSVYGGKNLTVQWCLVAQSLVNAGHEKGPHGYGGNWGGSGASYHHNLIVHHTSRTPRLGPRPGTQTDERMDMRNNVMYNWAGEGCYGGEGMNVNIVNNYYKPGPATMTRGANIQKRIAGIGVRTSEYTGHNTDNPNSWDIMWHKWGTFYVTGNYNSLHSDVTNDNWKYGIKDQINNSKCDNTFNDEVEAQMKLSKPIDYYAVTTHTAEMAYERVLSYVGCSKQRDSYDNTMVNDVREGKATYTASGNTAGFINSQNDCGGWPTLNSTDAPKDTDGDGMPDEWESANGLNPNDASDGTVVCADGYTNLEHYLNSLVADITDAQNAGGTMQGDIIEAATPDADDGLTTVASGTLLWKFNTGAAGQTGICSEELADAIELSSVAIGSNLSYTGTRTLGGSPLTGIQPLVDNEATANDGNALTFAFTVRDGYLFKPTKLSFTAARIGTDGGRMDLFWQNADGKTEIESSLQPERNDNFTSYNESINGVAAAGSANSLVIHIYKLGKTKQIVLGNIEVAGELKTAATGISDITTNRTPGNAIYNLQGVEVQKPTKGIYISNGKKIVIKTQ